MLKIGITGGIGSGKTTVCKIFSRLGVPVFYADEEARKILELDPEVVRKVKKQFGNEMYFHDGKPNRKKIAGWIFGNEKELKKLNAIIHPVVLRNFSEWCVKQKSVLLIKEAAILFESGSHKGLDFVITVSASRELRIQRTMTRDGSSRKPILYRMKRQMNERERIRRSDFVIVNDNKHLVIPQVMKIYSELISRA